MNIAIMCHNRKQELMVQFCTAYCGILSKHTVCATNATGRMVAEATGLPVNLFLSHEHGGIEQIGQRIIYNEIDLVLFFNSPQDNSMDETSCISPVCAISTPCLWLPTWLPRSCSSTAWPGAILTGASS